MLTVQQNWALGVRYLHLNKCILCDYYKHSERLKGSLGILNHFPCYFVVCQGHWKWGEGLEELQSSSAVGPPSKCVHLSYPILEFWIVVPYLNYVW